MEVLDADTNLAQVICQLFRRALGEGRYQHPLFGLGPLAAFVDEIVDLPPQRLKRNLGVHQTGGADH